jgi:hypothetical protein
MLGFELVVRKPDDGWVIILGNLTKSRARYLTKDLRSSSGRCLDTALRQQVVKILSKLVLNLDHLKSERLLVLNPLQQQLLLPQLLLPQLLAQNSVKLFRLCYMRKRSHI